MGCFDVLQKYDSRVGFGEAQTLGLSLTPKRAARGTAIVLSNMGLMTRKHRATGRVPQRSEDLGKTLPSFWS